MHKFGNIDLDPKRISDDQQKNDLNEMINMYKQKSNKAEGQNNEY